MNSKIATLLSENIKNKQVIADMIKYICDKNHDIENDLIDLCLGNDKAFITKEIVLKHIDKIQELCMKHVNNAINVFNINVVDVNNITCYVTIEYKAEITAWFKDQESADKGYFWHAIDKEDNEHSIKGTYVTDYSMYVSFKDLGIN